MNIQEPSSSYLIGEVRITNLRQMNYCLDSTNESLTNGYGKALVYRRGSQKNQIWKITQSVIDDYLIISDNRNRRLASDINDNIGVTSSFPENELMGYWKFERRILDHDKNGFISGEFYLKNIYNGKYLTLRDDDNIILSDLTRNDKRQLWMPFSNIDAFLKDVSNSSISLASPVEMMADRSRYQFLKRTWTNEQIKQQFTITNIRTTVFGEADYRWYIHYSEAGADSTIESHRNRLISREGYAMVFLDTGSYSDQYWFIDKLPGYKNLFIITNRADGKILKTESHDSAKAIVEGYTLFSAGSTNSHQYWALPEFSMPG